MKGSVYISTLGTVTGILLILLGAAVLAAGPLLMDPLDSMLGNSARGLRTSSSAIRTVTEGVSSSTGMINEVQSSMHTTSSALYRTGDVLNQTVEILEETRAILPAIANDMASMPPMLRNIMPGNHFDEVAERTENVAAKLGLLNGQLENLSFDVISTSGAIEGIACSVDTLRGDILSAEGSFNEAAEKMERTAEYIERGSFSKLVVFLSFLLGILLVLAGLYLISSGRVMRDLMNRVTDQ